LGAERTRDPSLGRTSNLAAKALAQRCPSRPRRAWRGHVHGGHDGGGHDLARLPGLPRTGRDVPESALLRPEQPRRGADEVRRSAEERGGGAHVRKKNAAVLGWVA